MLSDEHYQALLKASGEVDPPFELALILAHETGHRIGSIRLLRWSDVDWEKNSIRWRGENDKIGFEHVTPLTAAAKEALSRARKVQGAIGDSWVFPAPENPSLPVSRHLVRDWWERGENLAEISSRAGARLAQPPAKVCDGVEAHAAERPVLPRWVEGAADGSQMLPAAR